MPPLVASCSLSPRWVGASPCYQISVGSLRSGSFDDKDGRAVQLATSALARVAAHAPAADVLDALAPVVPIAAGTLGVLRPGAPGSMMNHNVRIPDVLLDTWMRAPPEQLEHALAPMITARPGDMWRDAETIHGAMREQLEALRDLDRHGLGEGAGYKVAERSSPYGGAEHVMLTLLSARGDVFSDRSKRFLRALAPDIQAAVQRTELPLIAREPLFAQVAAEEALGYVCLSTRGSVLESNRRAHELAARYHEGAAAPRRHALTDLVTRARALVPGGAALRVHGGDGVSEINVYVHRLRKEVHALGEDIDLLVMREWRPRGEPDPRDSLALLTPRQREIALLLAHEALSTKQIAARLDISQSTVRKHVENIHAILGVHSNPELLRMLKR